MAISTNQKVDFLFKKIGYGVADTDVNQYKSPSNESISSPLLIRGDNIWVNSGDIPLAPPSITSNIIRVYAGIDAIKLTEDLTSTTNRTWKTGITNWIGTEFGPQYQLKVYVDSVTASNPSITGTRIFADGSGNDDSWFFDYQSGVLRFSDTNLPPGVSSSAAIFVEGYQYVGPTGLPNSVTDSSVANQLSTLSNVATSGSYNDLTDTPTVVSAFINDANYVTTTELANVAANVPTNVSALVNDANFATVDYVSTSISNLVGNAPALLDTLNELSNAIGDDPSFISTITSSVALKANTADLAPVATSGSYTDLQNTPVQTFTFSEALIWTVVHNRNTTNIIESLYDVNNQRLYALVNIIDENRFEVVLTEATAGRVTVFFA